MTITANETIKCSWCKKKTTDWLDIENDLLPGQRGHSYCAVMAMAKVYMSQNKRRYTSKKTSPEQAQRIVAQRKEGMSLFELAQLHGMTQSGVSKLLKRHSNDG